MMGTLDAIVLYVVVAAVIVGFLAVAGFMLKIQAQSELTDKQRASGFGGRSPPMLWPRHAGKGRIPGWAYVSAYNEHEDVCFYDPINAYEYVITALADLNRDIDRLENTVDQEVPSECKHMQREYWLDNLKEFREDSVTASDMIS